MAVRAGPSRICHYHHSRWPTDPESRFGGTKRPGTGIRLLLDANRSTSAFMANLPKKPGLDIVPTTRPHRGNSRSSPLRLLCAAPRFFRPFPDIPLQYWTACIGNFILKSIPLTPSSGETIAHSIAARMLTKHCRPVKQQRSFDLCRQHRTSVCSSGQLLQTARES